VIVRGARPGELAEIGDLRVAAYEAGGFLADASHYGETLRTLGHDGVGQIGIRVAVRDLDAHRRFYGGSLGLTEEPHVAGASFRAGETLIILEQDRSVSIDAGVRGKGWRYITFQVFKVDDAHAGVLASGGREAVAPVTLGTTARISMVLDPDGNWIELSQRASIVGALA